VEDFGEDKLLGDFMYFAISNDLCTQEECNDQQTLWGMISTSLGDWYAHAARIRLWGCLLTVFVLR
jgi:hypothetical protein